MQLSSTTIFFHYNHLDQWRVVLTGFEHVGLPVFEHAHDGGLAEHDLRQLAARAEHGLCSSSVAVNQ
jgi:hypothetical protein